VPSRRTSPGYFTESHLAGPDLGAGARARFPGASACSQAKRASLWLTAAVRIRRWAEAGTQTHHLFLARRMLRRDRCLHPEWQAGMASPVLL
jgi:hypothetical protein